MPSCVQYIKRTHFSVQGHFFVAVVVQYLLYNATLPVVYIVQSKFTGVQLIYQPNSNFSLAKNWAFNAKVIKIDLLFTTASGILEPV